MTGKIEIFVLLFKGKMNHNELSFHCVIHQEAIRTQTKEVVCVMVLVTKTVNQIMAKELSLLCY